MSIEKLQERQREIRARLQELDTEYAGEQFPDVARTEWEELNAEDERNEVLIEELHVRTERLRELSGDASSREVGATFHTARPSRTTGEDIYDLSTVRTSFADVEGRNRELRDRVLRSIEEARFPHPAFDRDQDGARSHVERLLHRFSDVGVFGDSGIETFARRILATGSAVYKRAWAKSIAQQHLTQEEQRAMSLTGSAGGFAVPYTLDPTVVPTSNSSVNPFRAIARVEPILNNTWKGVTSGGITAAYAAEGTEASDNSPTLAQPSIDAERAQAFVPFSIEIGQDWGAIEAEMAREISDAKDDLEATKFLTGGGTNEPFGVLTGLSTGQRKQTAGTAAFVVGDVYGTEEKLAARFRPRGQWVGSRHTYNLIRQFATADGPLMWQDNLRVGLPNNGPTPGNLGSSLIGYPAWELSTMDAVLTTGSQILIFGDWRYFCIVERIGMSIEIIPHLFGSSNRFPTGQRGLYAMWRNGSKVLNEAGLVYLETL